MKKEMKKKMQEIADDFALGNIYSDRDASCTRDIVEVGFEACHDIMQAEVEKHKSAKAQYFLVKERYIRKASDLEKDRDEWKAQAEKLAHSIEYYFNVLEEVRGHGQGYP